MVDFLRQQYGLSSARIKRLVGYDNVNYLVTAGNKKYIFKTYDDAEMLPWLEMETRMLCYLQEQTESPQQYPAPIANHKGDYVFLAIIEEGKTAQPVRLLSFVDGEFLGDIRWTDDTYASLGEFLARMDLSLLSYKDITLKAKQSPWDLQYLHLNKSFIHHIPQPEKRKLVTYFFQQFEEQVRPHFDTLRQSIIHNDANEWNVLSKNGSVNAIIDFGDLAYTFLINELAVSLTYMLMGQDQPLEKAAITLNHYHQILPLKALEVDLLYYLIAGRLCTSLCQSAYSRAKDPTNTYASSSEEGAWALLDKWFTINPTQASNTFREAIGVATKEVPASDEALAYRNEHLSSILSVSYKKPIYMERAAFQYMYDRYGNTYLDAYNNIPHVGHMHPKVVEAGQRQMAQLNTNTRYLYDELPKYAEKLLSYFPKKLNKVFFVNSGSAASDLAMRLATTHTQKEQLLVMEHGYHGNTQKGIDISHYKFGNSKGQGQRPHILKATIPDTYNGPYQNNDGTAGKQYAEDVIRMLQDQNADIAAFITEPVVGCGGQVPLAKDYLKTLYPYIRSQGGVCISDEVQTGFGRLGEVFWGYEAQEVTPDIVILGKPIANGHPMGAVVTTTEIAASFEQGVEFFSSFGGNPVSCAIAESVLEVMEEEQLQENARLTGLHYTQQLKELQQTYACIGDVRGSGLFLGAEIIDPSTGKADTEMASYIKNYLREKYILISTDGPYDNVIKSKPPLCFSKRDAEQTVETIAEALQKYYE
ncbi:aminotransferase class III-fold pyridoxal phosphate-dependent enzyme [Algivirga pacifica]|uniref:Aminotransferase class III-fold pyridoxal phosphate-dependent enzyme n=1 Tax=Algivirga pacifica TaxID=1162670 RepID=A0ABP9DCQ6_9BACT